MDACELPDGAMSAEVLYTEDDGGMIVQLENGKRVQLVSQARNGSILKKGTKGHIIKSGKEIFFIVPFAASSD